MVTDSIDEPGTRLIDLVYGKVIARILLTSIAKDEKINVHNMARELGVSRTPVNTVLYTLEKQGIVTREATSGWVLPRISKKSITDTFDILNLLFPQMVSNSARRIALSSPEIINTFVHEIKRALIFKDWGSVHLADNGFMGLITINTDNDQLQRLVNNLWAQLARLRNGYYRIYGLRDMAWKNYEFLSEAIISGKEDNAAVQAKEFINNAKIAYLDFYEDVLFPISISNLGKQPKK